MPKLCKYATYEAALANAAAQGHVQVVEFLYDHGISADTRSGITGRTALHLPAKLNRINVVKFLVNVGADINVMDNAGNTPLHYAAISNQAEIAKFLVDRGADINIKNNDGKIPLEAAVSHNSLEVVNILKKYSPY